MSPPAAPLPRPLTSFPARASASLAGCSASAPVARLPPAAPSPPPSCLAWQPRADRRRRARGLRGGKEAAAGPGLRRGARRRAAGYRAHFVHTLNVFLWIKVMHRQDKKHVQYIEKVLSRSGSLPSKYRSRSVYIFNLIYTRSLDPVLPNGFNPRFDCTEGMIIVFICRRHIRGRGNCGLEAMPKIQPFL